MLAGWKVALALAALTQLSGSVAPVVRRFEERYRSATALEAAFLERYTENGHLTRAEAGIAYFHRPGRMRWEYESPEKNLFLVDSRWAWFYVPADHTVTRVPAKRSSDWRTPIVLLADNPKLSKVCSQIAPSVTVSPDVAGDTVLFCFMRGSKPAGGASDNQIGSSSQAVESRAIAQGDAIFLELEPQTGVLTRVLVTQPGGISIEFRFSNWQFDPILPDSLFRFEPPAGVAIVDGELPAEGRR